MREAGILMHISSLPSPYGIGTLGEEAHAFADFLSRSGCGLWQMLPLGPTGSGDSPYQSFSSYAGNPYFIDPGRLCREGLLTESECRRARSDPPAGPVDYGALYAHRTALLARALPRFTARPPKGYDEFCRRNAAWLDDYALFSALHRAAPDRPWQEWESGVRTREPEALSRAAREQNEGVRLERMLQYLFWEQWGALKAHCRSAGVRIIGDIPIYVSADSADVWSDPQYFVLGADLRPTALSGCPPDGFTAAGQLWGNPLYDWAALARDGYDWWFRRLRHALAAADILRIDHFRGFDSYYAVPAGSPNAVFGRWQRGPGAAFFDALRSAMGDLPLIAEDLGYLTDSVRALLAHTGYPGMKVLQFGFGEGGGEYLPHHYPTRCVVYTGTHDNPPLAAFFADLPAGERAFAAEYLGLPESADTAALTAAAVRAAFASVGERVVVPMQDLLALGEESRMNVPSTPSGNWRWRLPALPDDRTAARLHRLCATYGRLSST